MIDRLLGVSFLGILLVLSLSPISAAQGDICQSKCWTCFAALSFLGWEPTPPPRWAMLVDQNTLPGLGELSVYATRTNLCPAPECPTCPGPGSPAPPMANAPICLGTGNTFIQQTDVMLPGLGGGITLIRRWNSIWPSTQATSSVGMFGPNWRSTYEERVFVGSDYYIKYLRGDGNFWSFGLSPTGWLPATPANANATLVQGNNYWTITFQNGEQRQFNLTTGLLTAIIDRNGNTTQLSYDSSNRLVTVTSAASQHLYFSYGNASFPYVVTSVTSDFGLSLSYSYDAQGRLNQFAKPDLATVSFTYNTQSQITAVTDNNGKVLESHTYDSSGRGLTASQANGVNAVTVTYPQ